MTTPHKHAEYIIAFAQGRRVEYKNIRDSEWSTLPNSIIQVFCDHRYEFRIAPATMLLGKREVPVPKTSQIREGYNFTISNGGGTSSLYFDLEESRDAFWSALVELVRENTK